jgi:hypothetical protein
MQTISQPSHSRPSVLLAIVTGAGIAAGLVFGHRVPELTHAALRWATGGVL